MLTGTGRSRGLGYLGHVRGGGMWKRGESRTAIVRGYVASCNQGRSQSGVYSGQALFPRDVLLNSFRTSPLVDLSFGALGFVVFHHHVDRRCVKQTKSHDRSPHYSQDHQKPTTSCQTNRGRPAIACSPENQRALLHAVTTAFLGAIQHRAHDGPPARVNRRDPQPSTLR